MRESCAARLFGPGLPAAGREARLEWTPGRGLALLGGDLPRGIAWQTLALRRVGFDGLGLELAWRDASGAWACQVLDGAAATRLLAGLPPALDESRAALERARRRARRRALLPWTVLGLLLAVPLLLILLVVFAQARILDAIAARVPAAVEARLGAAALAQVRAHTRLSQDGVVYQEVRAVAQRLLADRQPGLQLFIAADDAINAFALPGGTIVVNRGLVAATRSAEQLAGVLAHELQHVELRHGLQAMLRTAGLSVLWSWVLGDLGGSLAGQAADQLLTLKFSRDAEREADMHAFDLLVARRIDPRGMVEFFTTRARADRRAPPALLSTHPSSAERRGALAARLASVPADCCAPLAHAASWPPLP